MTGRHTIRVSTRHEEAPRGFAPAILWP